MKLVMLLLVRDEIDIVATNMSYHLDHGVDFVLAIDNGSVDGTREVLEDYARAGVAEVIDEPGRDFNQTAWTTRAALRARDAFGADFIFSNDADEFWTAPKGDLKAGLADTKADLLVCKRLNMVYPWDKPDTGPWIDRIRYRPSTTFPRPALQDIYTDPMDHPYLYHALAPKVMMRAQGLRQIKQGNHNAAYEDAARKEASAIEVFHYPIRNRDQLCRKVVQGGKAYAANTTLPPTAGWHWRRWYRMYQERGIEAVLAEALPSDAALTADLASGVAVTDTRFIDICRAYRSASGRSLSQ
ncbi:glycosyltransferase family 2 protein [Roseovarius aestuariivivens]|uniref:glycosyltransferase family 2 protein n=1 Tax=Roseovarius aestuariivivens TaxID=1888910 RepID=UPI001080C79A|nr:glycosyltransferase family 2 protein [Roseovarius aestuariivivens]